MTMPRTDLMVVVLPAPFPPMKPVTHPAGHAQAHAVEDELPVSFHKAFDLEHVIHSLILP